LLHRLSAPEARRPYEDESEETPLNAKINDLMARRVITAQRHHTVEHVRGMMTRNRVHAIPIVDSVGGAAGIVTSADLVAAKGEGSPVSQVMSERVYTVPAYNDAHVAARIMRKHRIHHVVVTHEKKVVGLISSFDLLRLVEDHRFVAKTAPTEPRNPSASARSADESLGSKSAPRKKARVR
jgi:CBS domain-containing protein